MKQSAPVQMYVQRVQPGPAAAFAVGKPRQESPFWNEGDLSKGDVGVEGAVRVEVESRL